MGVAASWLCRLTGKDVKTTLRPAYRGFAKELAMPTRVDNTSCVLPRNLAEDSVLTASSANAEIPIVSQRLPSSQQ